MDRCYCKGIILIVLGLLFLLESISVFSFGILKYMPALFIVLGILYLIPCCCSCNRK